VIFNSFAIIDLIHGELRFVSVVNKNKTTVAHNALVLME